MTKQEFKICEAVALGLTHYYMGPKDKHVAERIHHDVRILQIFNLEKKINFFRQPLDNTLTIMYIIGTTTTKSEAQHG